jgi:carboxymethylenebutenolidase
MPISRRQFVVGSTFTAGFALAVQPIVNSAIQTSSKNLVSGSISIPSGTDTIPAYYAAPAKGDGFPIVLVIQEIFGVHEHIRDVVRRFAQLGYVAIAPELFARQGDVSKLKEIDDIRKIVAKVPDAQVLADIDASLNWVVQNAKGSIDRVAITGFCWGGRITWLYAAHNPKIKAGVAWYGRLTGDKKALNPQQPIDIAANLTVPVLGLYGGQDTGIPLDSVELTRQQLEKGKSGSSIIVYPDAPHAFFADYRPSYRQKDAQDGWKRLQAWFKDKGVAPV